MFLRYDIKEHVKMSAIIRQYLRIHVLRLDTENALRLLLRQKYSFTFHVQVPPLLGERLGAEVEKKWNVSFRIPVSR